MGNAVLFILSGSHDSPGNGKFIGYGNYKSRKTPSGDKDRLHFDDYLEARWPEKWAAWASTKTRLEIQLDFVDWCYTKEKERGFTDEEQREECAQYYKLERDLAVREHSEPAGAMNQSQPVDTPTNRPSAAAGSGRSP